MTCKKCGNHNIDAWRFCGKCGAPLDADQARDISPLKVFTPNANNDTVVLPQNNEPAAISTAQPMPFGQNSIQNPELKLKTPKNTQKYFLLITIVLFVISGITVASLFAVSALNTREYDELIDTGTKYLDELKYEEAVETYLAAIDVKPKREEAYIGAATGYIGLDEPDNAKGILEDGLKKVKKPSGKFTDLCDELGVSYEGSQAELKTTNGTVKKQYTEEDIEELSRYFFRVGSDQIDWNNMNQEDAITVFWGAKSVSDLPNVLVEGSENHTKLTGMLNDNAEYMYITAYSLSDVNKNVKYLFGDKSRPLSKNDFTVFDGTAIRIHQSDGPIFVRCYPDLDWIVVITAPHGYEDMDLDFIVDSKTQGDTIHVRRCFFTISVEDIDRVPYEPSSVYDWSSASFSQKQEVAKNYYNSAKSVGINVYDFMKEYALAYNADGTIYLKSVYELDPGSIVDTPEQTTQSLFGRSISNVYMVKTIAGGPLNIRSGPGLTYDSITTIPNGTLVNASYFSKDEQWIYIMVNGVYGWSSKDFLVIYS